MITTCNFNHWSIYLYSLLPPFKILKKCRVNQMCSLFGWTEPKCRAFIDLAASFQYKTDFQYQLKFSCHSFILDMNDVLSEQVCFNSHVEVEGTYPVKMIFWKISSHVIIHRQTSQKIGELVVSYLNKTQEWWFIKNKNRINYIYVGYMKIHHYW